MRVIYIIAVVISVSLAQTRRTFVDNGGQYYNDNSGQYRHDNSGAYNSNEGQYHPDSSGAYVADDSGAYRGDNQNYVHQEGRFGSGTGLVAPATAGRPTITTSAIRTSYAPGTGQAFSGQYSLGRGSAIGAPRYTVGTLQYTAGAPQNTVGAVIAQGVRTSGLVSGSNDNTVGALRYTSSAPQNTVGTVIAQGVRTGGSVSGSYDNRNYAVIVNEADVRPDGYHYVYNTENRIAAEEQGQLANVGTDNEALQAKGHYEYTGPDGVLYRVDYTADENGFVPVAEHLPVAPPIPEAILRSLEYQRSIGQL